MNLFKFWKSYFLDQFTLHLGGGGGGGGPTQTNVQNTNVPEYAKPYVETMLGATQQQLFNTTQVAAEGETPGYTRIDSFKPYQAYGGTYDDKGKQLSYDPSKSIAGFSPAQIAAQQGITGMQMPGGFAGASNMASAAGQGGIDSAARAYGYGDQGQRSGLMGQGLGIAGGQKYGDLGVSYGAQGANLGVTGGQSYGTQGADYGRQAAGLAPQAQTYGKQAADIGSMGLRAEEYGRNVSGQAENYARQAAGAGAQYAQMVTDPRATQALMNPYTQNVLDVQNRELDRQANIAGAQRGAQAARAGAFGGSRQAIENAEANRNLAGMKTANTAQALNQAYQQAQAQQQFGANLNLQGLQGAQQGLGTALQGGQLGLSGIGTALQGQQGALAGLGAANQAYQTGIQGAGMGLQGVNAQLAGTAQGMQGAQTGLQGVDRQLAGTAQGMQGAQVGLQGVSGAQAGYSLANQAASNMSNIAGQQQQAQLNMLNAQNTVGAQQQAMEQQIKNQAIQDYANAQQYPLMQLGTMSNMLRGLPMQASSTQQYQAAPSPVSQFVGAAGAGASLLNAFNPPKAAAGGEVKGYAKGGIMSYDMGGEVESQLESMDEKGLTEQAKESSSPSIRKMAQRILRERQMSRPSQGTGPMGVQYQAAQPPMPTMRGGGIIAFQTGNEVKEEEYRSDPFGAMTQEQRDARRNIDGLTLAEERAKQQRPYSGPSSEAGEGDAVGIMSATPPPAAAPVSKANAAMQGAANIPEFMKAQYAETDKRMNAPLSDFMAERRAAMQEAGVADVSEGQRKQRAEMMAEKANMSEENQRQKYLRMAEFFAAWGSTPGPTLVAGMNALKQSVPGIIADEKEQKKARREIDKSIADLDNATRLEKRGEVDAAMALKLKAAEDMKALQIKLVDYQSARETDKRALEQTTMTTAAQLEAERMRAKTQGGVNAQRAEETRMYNIERSLEIARKRLSETEKSIDDTRNKPPKGTPLAKAMESVNRYNNILEKNKGDVSKIDDFIRKDAEQGAAVVKRFEDSATRRLQEARDQVQMYEDTYLTQGRGAKAGAKTSKSKDDPYDIMGILKEEPPASAAPANAPAPASASDKTSTSRTGDGSKVNPYVDTKGKAKPDAPRGGASIASQLVDAAPGMAKDAANKVNEKLNNAELRYLKDKIDRKETLSATDRVRAQRAGLL